MSFFIRYNGKKEKISATPSTTLQKMLVEACSRFKVDSSSFELEHKRKKLDLSLPFRLCSISNNAIIDLVPGERSVFTASLTPVDFTRVKQVVSDAADSIATSWWPINRRVFRRYIDR